VPYKRYGETPEQVVADISAWSGKAFDRELLLSVMKPGAARNGLDCALWDLAAKQTGRRAHELAGVTAPGLIETCFTLSLDTPDAMHKAARAASDRPILKVKLGGDGDCERIRAVRAGAPNARLIVDANESWNETNLVSNFAACREVGVILIEQPLHAQNDADLASTERLVPVCADESLHDRRGLAGLKGRYDAINIKLDKAGGLTEALLLSSEARRLGFQVMVGCMLATSLAMAPALLMAQSAEIVDLDGPLLLAEDRPFGLRYNGSIIEPADPRLWG
jgi:L-alanine-DL-glutamate epimerase-like enolase superfamily enzyme